LIEAWLLLLALLYVGLLFAVAHAGDRHPGYLRRPQLRTLVYALSLAVYCSSWTFYGAVGTAARAGIAYLPIYLGPILLFVFGASVLRRLATVVRQRKITSIADFVGARFGQSHGLAALVTVVAVLALVPYIALQLKAIDTSFRVFAKFDYGAPSFGNIDSAFWCGVLLAVFAILFSTRSVNSTEHHRGMVLAIALESGIKLLVFVAVAAYALWEGPGIAATVQLPVTEINAGLPNGFITQTLLALCVMMCLPHEFHIGMVESEDNADLDRARWVLPLYMVVVCLAVLPIVATGMRIPQVQIGLPDAWVLSLPLALGNHAVAFLAFIGGFAASTGVAIVATVALSIMISNDLVIPVLLRMPRLRLAQGGDMPRLVLRTRRLAIAGVMLAAYAYYRATANSGDLATLGLLSFTAMVQVAPALLAALYWRGASRRGVMAGLAAGFAVWMYALLLPTLVHPWQWLHDGPFGLIWLRPQALFFINGWSPLTNAMFWSLTFNIGCLLLFSRRFRPSLSERLYADSFMDSGAATYSDTVKRRGRVKVADLRTIAGRIVGERISTRAFDEYSQTHGRPLQPGEAADSNLIQHTERLLASAVGAANARRILIGALSGSGLDVAESMALLDAASQESRFNRELLSTTLENVSHGISVVDADMRLVAWNRRYLEMFDYPDGLVYVGVPIANLIRWNAERGECGPGEANVHVDKRISHMQAGSPHMFQRVRSDGTVIEIRGRALAGGGYVTTYSDVTAYKHTEQALLDINQTLEQRVQQRTAELSDALAATAKAKHAAELANASKARFLAAVSHDLLQPLNAARLFTSALRADPELDAEGSRLAERIDASFTAAGGLLEALLDMSRLDAGSYHPEITDFALDDLFVSLQNQFEVIAAQRGLRVRVAHSKLAAHSDPQLLRRIVQNLLSNALRYTGNGGVLLGARRTHDRVRIEVWDTGPGIPAEHCERIFEEFHRLEQPSPWGEQGLGLGLAICDRLASILNHRLDLHTWIGHGSCFTISVPRNRAAPPPHRQRSDHGGASQQLPSTVLCVDNDVAILDGMRALLGRWGVDCRVAVDVGQTRAELMRGGIDLLLVDYHLGDGVDGLLALQQLRESLGHLPSVVVITADGSTTLKQRARALGYPLLHKPVRPAALRALLAASLRNPVTREHTGAQTPSATAGA
jgi:Na+/proline symporter/signal transduction histidine kinase